jgi:ATP/maltotriose-dependent transcriptional regulator MalT
MATVIVGRETELETIVAFLADVERGPAALVLSGEAGIGKTILWEATVEDARSRFGSVLTCRGVEAEASLSFAGLSELLAPVFDDVGSSLLPPRRRALEIALLLVEPGERPPDPHAIGLAVLDLLRASAEQGPVLVALDDVQWLDPASLGVIQIALRRLRAEPVGLLATLRVGSDVGSFELDRSFPESRLVPLAVGPLSLAAVHDLLEDRLGLELTRPELARVHEATAGNPFFALELGRELVRTDSKPSVGRPLPVPDSLQELLGGRLARLPGETLDVLLIVAALARPTVELVTTVQGDDQRVREALETAVQEGVIELDDSAVRFAHPLIASLCYEQAPVWKRRAVHRALADAVTDSEERARHLALATDGPDAGIAAELDAAAGHAAVRGAPAAAGELSQLAADLTPDDDGLSRHRRLQAARFYSLAGHRDQAAGLLDQLLVEVPGGVERADVLYVRASTLRGDAPSLIAMCDEALECARDDDGRSARILAYRTLICLLEGNAAAALEDARAALEKAEHIADPELLVAVIARVAQAETWAGDVTPGLVERGTEIEERLGLELDYLVSPRAYLPRLLMRRGELERALSLLEEVEARAAAKGHEYTRLNALWYLSMAEWLGGRLHRALDYAAVAQELTEQMGDPGGWRGRFKALIEADLGLVEQARASAQAGLADARATSMESFIIATLGVLGRLELALGDLRLAGDYLRDLPDRFIAGGVNDPSQPVWADAIETLVGLGELERARTYLDHYELYAGKLQSPLAMEGALRCRALLLAAEGDTAAALTTLERAIDGRPDAPWPLERARTLLCLGTVRRQAQQKKAAREALEHALAVFEQLGAPLWAEKARAELRRISGRRPADEELTETERRVAELAAQGRTNKEIAAELFMGISTVESHLSRVYRKLGIRSRSGLGARLPKPRGETIEA